MTAGEEVKPTEVEVESSQETVSPAPPTKNGPEVTKLSFRMQTWEKLESMEQVVFPRPCKYRIPRFKGENEAVEKLAELDAFKAAKVVKVNLDKAQERVRLEIIQNGKSLIAGTPGLKEAVFLLMRPPMEFSKLANRMAASRIGIRHLGTALDFSSGIKADLVVLGSVAVDKKGHRIGKGEGFTDLEYALLSKLQIIDPDALIVTVVHDLQVYDEFPEDLFKPWDVPVDVIITPTQVIHVKTKLPRPTLIWNLLSNRRVNDIPIIKQLLEKEQLSGSKVELKTVDSETEGTTNYWPPMRTRRKRFVRRRRLTSAPPDGMPRGAMNRGSSAPPPRSGARTFRRRDRRQAPPTTNVSTDKFGQMDDNKGRIGLRRRLGPQIRRIRKPRYTVDFSVRIDGLTTGIRIRELKAALFERNVRPVDISWRAGKGIALLHFAKRRGNETTNGTNNVDMDGVVKMLEGLSVKTTDGQQPPQLKVEGVKPIPRPSATSVSESSLIQNVPVSPPSHVESAPEVKEETAPPQEPSVPIPQPVEAPTPAVDTAPTPAAPVAA